MGVDLSRDLFLEETLEGLAVLSEFPNTFGELVRGHLVLEKGPAKLGLVIDVGNFGDRVGLGGSSSIEFLGDFLVGVLELLKEGRGDGEEVDAGEGLDFASLDKGEEKGEII